MSKPSKRSRLLRRYWNDVRAIAKATGKKTGEARRLYRQAVERTRDHKRPAREKLVRGVRSIVRTERKAERRRQKIKAESSSKPEHTSLVDLGTHLERVGVGRDIEFATPFLTRDIKSATKEDVNQLVADMWAGARAWARAGGTNRDLEFPDNPTRDRWVEDNAPGMDVRPDEKYLFEFTLFRIVTTEDTAMVMYDPT